MFALSSQPGPSRLGRRLVDEASVQGGDRGLEAGGAELSTGGGPGCSVAHGSGTGRWPVRSSGNGMFSTSHVVEDLSGVEGRQRLGTRGVIPVTASPRAFL